MAFSTLLQLQSQLLDEIKVDPNKRINSNTLLNRNIRRALDRIQEDTNYSLPENLKVAIITPNAQEKDLPADFKRIAEPHGVKLGQSTPLFPVDYVALLGQFSLTENTGGPTQYYVRMNNNVWVIGFFPVPQTQYDVTVPYYAFLINPVADSDYSPLPTEYDEAVVQYAAYLTMRRIRGFETQAQEYLAFYKDALNIVTQNTQMANRHALKFGMQRRQNYGYWNAKSPDGPNYYY